MKFLIILTLFLFNVAAACFQYYYTVKIDKKPAGEAVKFTRMNVDDRGLISCEYVIESGDTMALDYLTPHQLKALIK